MDEGEKQKSPHNFNWDHINEMLNRGLGTGRRDSVDAFRMAFQNGLIGPRPPMQPLDPFEFPVKPQPDKPKSKQDLADAKIAELESRLTQERFNREREQEQNHRLRQEVHQLRVEMQQLQAAKSVLRQRLDFELSRKSIPAFIKKYLKFIIFACHPDRNPGRGEAVEVTKALLELRREG